MTEQHPIVDFFALLGRAWGPVHVVTTQCPSVFKNLGQLHLSSNKSFDESARLPENNSVLQVLWNCTVSTNNDACPSAASKIALFARQDTTGVALK